MRDQANDLRELVRRQSRRAASTEAGRPALIAVTGGKGGVGTTTLAVNLAVALARARQRTVLVDADLDGGDASLLCRLKERSTVADVLSARRTVREVLQPGPGGIHVVPGVWGLDRPPEDTPAARQRLLEGLAGLERQADFLIVDSGNGLRPMVESCWEAATAVLLVATPELSAVMGAYASVKAMSSGNLLVPIHLVVNRAPDEDAASDAHQRIAQACLRFLAMPVTSSGWVADDPQVAICGGEGRPFGIAAPECQAARQIDQLARSLVAIARRNPRHPQPPGHRLARAGTPLTA